MRIIFTLLFSISFISTSFASDVELNKDTNKKSPAIANLFPREFSAEQIYEFFRSNSTKVPSVGLLEVDEIFKKDVSPYAFQFLTGRASSYSSKINFLGETEVIDGELYGKYNYTSSYETIKYYSGYYSVIPFKVKLIPDDSLLIYNLDKHKGVCQIYDLKSTILGKDRDFISTRNQLENECLIPDASLIYILMTDEKFIEQTRDIQRLEGNTKDWLLLLEQLKNQELHTKNPKERNEIADDLYSKLLGKYKYDKSKMDKKGYNTCLSCLREEILSYIGISSEYTPIMINDIIRKKNKIYLVAPTISSDTISRN